MTIRHSLIALGLLVGPLSAGTLAADALPPLSENTYVTERLLAGRIADRIRTECPGISARYLTAYRELRALEAWVIDQGYTQEELDAFIRNNKEKKALKAAAEEYLAANGATDEAGFCALGRTEIEQGSLVGSLIYEN